MTPRDTQSGAWEGIQVPVFFGLVFVQMNTLLVRNKSKQ